MNFKRYIYTDAKIGKALVFLLTKLWTKLGGKKWTGMKLFGLIHLSNMERA